MSICVNTGRECYKSSELSLLFEVSKLMNQHEDIKEILQLVTKLIASFMGSTRVMITILNRKKDEIGIEVGYGVSDEARKRATYRVGEGVIGQVVRTGSALFIPKINEDIRFLNKTGANLLTSDRKDLSFTCVPIKQKEFTTGAICLEKPYDKGGSYQDEIRLVSIIGSMIADVVAARQTTIEELEKLREEKAQLEKELHSGEKCSNIIGSAGSMCEVFKLINMVAKTNANVLIRGESGVGKELVADAIHKNSTRANNVIIKINCAALPETLIESELFGHEKGSFTGAVAQKKGRFELANGGTIFLDEIGDLPLQTQVKLLRIIQQKEFERVGGTETLKTDVRIIAATNRNLEEMVKQGVYREDLFFRINVFPIFVPPLRDRISDLPSLVDHFIAKANRVNGTHIKRISSSALDMLMIYHWPGNIRELENCIERAAIMSTDEVIRAHNLPPTLQTAESSGTEMHGTLNTIVGKLEKQLIIDTLTKTRGNMIQAAKVLDITERMMGTRIKKYDIDPRRYKL